MGDLDGCADCYGCLTDFGLLVFRVCNLAVGARYVCAFDIVVVLILCMGLSLVWLCC